MSIKPIRFFAQLCCIHEEDLEAHDTIHRISIYSKMLYTTSLNTKSSTYHRKLISVRMFCAHAGSIVGFLFHSFETTS